MSAAIHCLDLPRVSTRAEIAGKLTPDVLWKAYETLCRRISREAEGLGPERSTHVYITVEQRLVVEEPDLGGAA